MVPVLSRRRTSTSPAASTARPDMATTFAWLSRFIPAMPMAESRAPMVVGARQTSSAASTAMETTVPLPATSHAEAGHRLKRDHHHEEDDGEAGQQDVERDLVGRLLALGPLDHGDHPVEEGLAGLGGHPDDQPVGEHPRAAGHGAAVAAALPDDRGALAGDGALVHRGCSGDDLAVGRDQLAGLHQDDVAAAQQTGSHVSRWRRPARVPTACGPCTSCRALRSVSAWARPRPSARASAKLAKTTVNQSSSEMARVKPGEPSACRRATRRRAPG